MSNEMGQGFAPQKLTQAEVDAFKNRASQQIQQLRQEQVYANDSLQLAVRLSGDTSNFLTRGWRIRAGQQRAKIKRIERQIADIERRVKLAEDLIV